MGRMGWHLEWLIQKLMSAHERLQELVTKAEQNKDVKQAFWVGEDTVRHSLQNVGSQA